MKKRLLTDKQHDHEIEQLVRYLKSRRLSTETGIALMGAVAANLIRHDWSTGNLPDQGVDELLNALHRDMRAAVFKPGTLEA
tara:strand:+ start:853 stop:1098 length:246 start_codon:yes stop_codon:yes gene_type:complete